MEFLYPGFLYALAALAIPILIHLFNFRKFKKVAFTNVRFLREIKLQTQSQNRLKHLLILLLRLLAIAFLVFAFAQPFIPEKAGVIKEGTKDVSIFIDNSFSMEGESEEGVMLEVAKNRAMDIAQAFAPTDRFQLLTQDFEGRNQRLVTRSEFNEMVQNVTISSRSHSLDEITARQNDLLKSDDETQNRSSFIISDFQKSRFDFTKLNSDSTIAMSLVYLPRNSPANLYIDSVWFSNPVRKLSDSDKLNVRIVNTGDEAVKNVPLKLSVNGKKVAIGSFGAAAKSETDTTLHFANTTAGLKRMEVSLDDAPVTYDNNYFLAYKVIDHINVTSIQDNDLAKDPFLSTVFKSDSSFDYHSISVTNVDYSKLPNTDLVILYEIDDIPSGLADALVTFANNGGSVWLIPSASANLDSYNQFLTEMHSGAITVEMKGDFTVRKLNTEHPLYTGVFDKLPRNLDLPNATHYYRYSQSVRSSIDNIMSFGNGDSFLGSYSVGQGKFYALAVPLRSEANNFSRHALFVATALRMAETSRATSIKTANLGSSFTLPGMRMGSESVFHLISTDGKLDVIPQYLSRDGQIEINPGSDVNEAGNYNIILGEDTVAAVGLNYPRSESDLESYSQNELEAAVANAPNKIKIYDGNSSQLSHIVEKASKGTELWKICLILVLLFLLGETLLLRFWKK